MDTSEISDSFDTSDRSENFDTSASNLPPPAPLRAPAVLTPRPGRELRPPGPSPPPGSYPGPQQSYSSFLPPPSTCLLPPPSSLSPAPSTYLALLYLEGSALRLVLRPVFLLRQVPVQGVRPASSRVPGGPLRSTRRCRSRRISGSRPLRTPHSSASLSTWTPPVPGHLQYLDTLSTWTP